MLLLSESRDVSDAGCETSEAERRRGLRVRQQRPIKVFEPVSGRYLGGRTEDVSATGLRVTLPLSSAVREGCTLTVHVGLSEHGNALANRRQMMPARIVWVDRPADLSTRTLSAGIEFITNIAAHLDAA